MGGRVVDDATRHHGLELPDGTSATSLRLEPLRAELRRLGIEGISAAMSKSELLDCFSAHVNKIAEDLCSPNIKPVFPLPQAAVREAVCFLEKLMSLKEVAI